MENYRKGIIAEKTPEISDTEENQPEEQPKEADESVENLVPANLERFFVSPSEAGFEADEQIEIPQGLNPRTMERIKAGAVFSKDVWIADHRFSRADSIAAAEQRKLKAKWERIRNEPELQPVPLAEIFRPRQIICEDEELFQIKEKAAAANVLKEQIQATQLINQIRDSCAKALVRRK